MKAIILVGGQGTRLRPLTLTRPKPLLPILNRPFLTYQFDILREAKIRDVALAIGKDAKPWIKLLKPITPRSIRVHYAIEKEPLGTGGAIRNAFNVLEKRSEIRDEPILVLNGDVFISLTMKRFSGFHRRNKAAGTIALTRVPDISRYGWVKTSKSGLIEKFAEKPKKKQPGWINAGAYLLNPKIIKKIPRKHISVERDIFPWLLAQKIKLFGYLAKGYWNDIGTPQSFLKAHKDLFRQNNRWTGGKYFRKRRHPRGKTLFGRGVKIGKGVQLRGFVCLGDGVQIGDGTDIRNSVIFRNVTIGKRVRLHNSVVSDRSRIGDRAQCTKGAILGEKAIIPPGKKF